MFLTSTLAKNCAVIFALAASRSTAVRFRRLSRNFLRSSCFVIGNYPRFLSGLGLLAALVRGEGSRVLEFWGARGSCSERAAARSSDFFTALRAALPLLFGLLFCVAIMFLLFTHVAELSIRPRQPHRR